jgi:hypothetical protein
LKSRDRASPTPGICESVKGKTIMAKTKYIVHQCAYCRRETKMEFVGGLPAENDGAEPSKTWYRCTRCKHSALLTLVPQDREKKNHAIPIDRETCTTYAKEKLYKVGEHIYHSEWDDVGKVIRKDKTSNGIQSIVVSFEKLGERKLLENIQTELPEEFVNNESTHIS